MRSTTRVIRNSECPRGRATDYGYVCVSTSPHALLPTAHSARNSCTLVEWMVAKFHRFLFRCQCSYLLPLVILSRPIGTGQSCINEALCKHRLLDLLAFRQISLIWSAYVLATVLLRVTRRFLWTTANCLIAARRQSSWQTGPALRLATVCSKRTPAPLFLDTEGGSHCRCWRFTVDGVSSVSSDPLARAFSDLPCPSIPAI